jgi:hypothetical protein
LPNDLPCRLRKAEATIAQSARSSKLGAIEGFVTAR